MSQITRPMLAGKLDYVDRLRYPVICSPKIDGIRALKIDGEIVSRSFKPIQNAHIRSILKLILPEGADGEIVCGSTFQSTSSGVMSREGKPEFVFYMFDLVIGDLDEPYDARLADMSKYQDYHPCVKVLPTVLIQNEWSLLEYEKAQLELGYEGVMIRSPEGPYKCGRSTEKEGWLLKLKRFVDAEAEVIGFEELQHNLNAKTVNELGLSKRSTRKSGKVSAGKLGKFLVRNLKDGVEFAIGTGEGLTGYLRQKIWNEQESYLGKIVKYRYQVCGTKDAPRIPIFVGFRDPDDM